MATLTVIKNNETQKIQFSGQPILQDILIENGVMVFSPCGRKGTCGKCKVILSGEVSSPNQKEISAGCRLACQTVLLGDATVELVHNSDFVQIETQTHQISPKNLENNWNYGVAIDIGTTTVVLKLFNSQGACLGEEACTNPQTALSADVIGRIDACLNQKQQILYDQIHDCIDKLISKALKKADIEKEQIGLKIITGNTAMLYIFANRNPKSIATSPFKSETLFGEWIDEKTYLSPCIDAFIGGDTVCSVLASGMCEKDEISLLCDMGTNGEIALWKDRKLYVTSTAMGPAFEGACLECGCGTVMGAIDKVYVENKKIKAETIGSCSAIGLCGSGIIDAVSVFLELGYIEKDGMVNRPLVIASNGGQIQITPEDIASIQLAKSAVFSGIKILLEETHTPLEDIKNFYLAGGFGSHISLENASKIGLIPKEFVTKTKILGNGALSGAIKLLFDRNSMEKAEKIAKNAQHIQLGGNPDFNSAFIENMMF